MPTIIGHSRLNYFIDKGEKRKHRKYNIESRRLNCVSDVLSMFLYKTENALLTGLGKIVGPKMQEFLMQVEIMVSSGKQRASTTEISLSLGTWVGSCSCLPLQPELSCSI